MRRDALRLASQAFHCLFSGLYSVSRSKSVADEGTLWQGRLHSPTGPVVWALVGRSGFTSVWMHGVIDEPGYWDFPGTACPRCLEETTCSCAPSQLKQWLKWH